MTSQEIKKNINAQKRENQIRKKKGLPTRAYNLLDERTKPFADGNQFSICEKCGSKFEQEYIPQRNAFQNYKTCHRCRLNEYLKREQVEENTIDAIIKYDPFPWQVKMHKDIATHRFGVLACGARTGKDFACMMEVVNQIHQLASEERPLNAPELVPSYVIWLVGPTEKILDQNWDYAKKFIPKEFLAKGDRSIKDSERKIELIQGGLLEVRSAYDEENLVSKAVDFLVITEAARIKNFDRVWINLEARLMSPKRGVLGKGGRALINSSPCGKNFFYEMFCWGQKNHFKYDSQFFSYQLSTDENPMIKAEMDELVDGFNGVKITKREQFRRRWGEKWYQQDYMAQFITAGGTVFPDFKEKCTTNVFYENSKANKTEIKNIMKQWELPKVGELYRIGYDPASGSSGDFPVMVVREMSTNNIVKIMDLYGMEDTVQLDTVAYWAKIYNHAEVCGLVLGYPHIENGLIARGCHFTKLNEQGQGKRTLIQALQRAVQSSDIHILYDGSAETEMLIFQMEDYTENEKTGKFSNVQANNDDYVSALYACYYDYSEFVDIKSHYSGYCGGVTRKKVSNY